MTPSAPAPEEVLLTRFQDRTLAAGYPMNSPQQAEIFRDALHDLVALMNRNTANELEELSKRWFQTEAGTPVVDQGALLERAEELQSPAAGGEGDGK